MLECIKNAVVLSLPRLKNQGNTQADKRRDDKQ